MTHKLQDYFSQKKCQLMRFVGWFYLVNAIVFIILGRTYLKSILYSVSLYKATTLKFIFIKKAYLILFSVLNYIVYMQFLAFLPAVFLLILILIAPSKYLTWITSIILGTISIICLVADTQLYAISEFHVNSTIIGYIFSGQALNIFDVSNKELAYIGFYIFFIVIFELISALIIWHKVILAKHFLSIGKWIALFWLSCFLFCYLNIIITTQKGSALFSQQTVDLPYYKDFFNPIIPNSRQFNNAFIPGQNVLLGYSNNDRPMNYPLHPMICEKPTHPYNLIFILVDSLRADLLNARYMPKTYAFAEKNWSFLNNNSGGNGTAYGLTSIFYSIPGTYFATLESQNVQPVFFDLLKKNQYQSEVYWSASFEGFSIFKMGDINYSATDEGQLDDVGQEDRLLTKKTIALMQSQKGKNNPFFVELFYDSVHGSCSKQSFPNLYSGTNMNQECSRISLTNNLILNLILMPILMQ